MAINIDWSQPAILPDLLALVGGYKQQAGENTAIENQMEAEQRQNQVNAGIGAVSQVGNAAILAHAFKNMPAGNISPQSALALQALGFNEPRGGYGGRGSGGGSRSSGGGAARSGPWAGMDDMQIEAAANNIVSGMPEEAIAAAQQRYGVLDSNTTRMVAQDYIAGSRQAETDQNRLAYRQDRDMIDNPAKYGMVASIPTINRARIGQLTQELNGLANDPTYVRADGSYTPEGQQMASGLRKQIQTYGRPVFTPKPENPPTLQQDVESGAVQISPDGWMTQRDPKTGMWKSERTATGNRGVDIPAAKAREYVSDLTGEVMVVDDKGIPHPAKKTDDTTAYTKLYNDVAQQMLDEQMGQKNADGTAKQPDPPSPEKVSERIAEIQISKMKTDELIRTRKEQERQAKAQREAQAAAKQQMDAVLSAAGLPSTSAFELGKKGPAAKSRPSATSVFNAAGEMTPQTIKAMGIKPLSAEAEQELAGLTSTPAALKDGERYPIIYKGRRITGKWDAKKKKYVDLKQ